MSDRPTSTLTDSKGRRIQVRALTVVEQAKMMRAIGPKQSGNQEYSGLVRLACIARDIDGTPIPYPIDERAVDRALEMLGDEGVIAVMQWMEAEIKATMDRIENESSEVTKPDPLVQSAS